MRFQTLIAAMAVVNAANSSSLKTLIASWKAWLTAPRRREQGHGRRFVDRQRHSSRGEKLVRHFFAVPSDGKSGSPELWVNKCRNVIRSSSPGKCWAAGVSSANFPASTNVITAVAVIGFVIEAIRNGELPFAVPNAFSKT